ncbi:MAG TPA: DUF1501 domain-containing protein [Nitrososphaerales archaeon]|nr:DUF1501 domain-containing protein [Nitrososphaerales archaeon]
MSIDRRTFLKQLAVEAGAVPSLTPFSYGPAVMEAVPGSQSVLSNANNRTLLVVQLGGGNDGINTVVPYSQQAYYQARPTLALQPNELLQIDGNVGLHPSMGGLMTLLKSHNAAILQGVGYANPNRSHFESTVIWESGSTDNSLAGGWLGRYLDAAKRTDPRVTAVNMGGFVPLTLTGWTSRGLSMDSLDRFRVFPTPTAETETLDEDTIKLMNEVACTACQEYSSLIGAMMQAGLDATAASDTIAKAASNYKTNAKYPQDDFGNRMKLAAEIAGSNLNPKIVYVELGGFDTHTNQKGQQADLLKTLSDGIAAFYQDMSDKGRANDTLIMTFSEFGRRVQENGNRGTDHGTAEPLFAVGGKVSSNLYGTTPSLTDLDQGDIKYGIDFREFYASVLDDWLGVDSSVILGQKYNKLSVFQ